MPHPPAASIIPHSTGLLLIILLLYFVPTVVAARRAHPQVSAIVIINVFLGWTFVGWVIALAMAFTAVTPSQPDANRRSQTPT